MKEVKIRFNKDAAPGSPLKWRAIIDGEEQTFSHININAPCKTTTDLIDGVEKHHITVECNSADVVNTGEHKVLMLSML